MLQLDFHPVGRHFLQIPGPSPVPDRILRAMSLPTIDHRGPEFAQLGLTVLQGMRQIFQTKHPVVIYPASGTGAWEAALVNTLSPGDHVLMYETGQFAALWDKLATRLGLKTEVVTLPGIEGWRKAVQAHLIEERLRPRGVAVVVKAEHLCMRMRGVEKQNSLIITSTLLGAFRHRQETRNEFMNLIHS